MRSKEELLDMGDTSAISQFKALSEDGVAVPGAYEEGQLVSSEKLNWALRTLIGSWATLFGPYPGYDNPGNNGIFKILKNSADEVQVAILGDWASNTAESHHIADMAKDKDYSIHLGDTYYVGNKKEIAANFFKENGGTWPYGNLGSFAMLGNHEMYSGGHSYFNDLLPRMGKSDGSQKQEASFFCLENEYWRIIGLDTGYDSLIEPQRLIQNKRLELMPKQIEWLRDTVRINDDKRGIIILSHHQGFSAFENEFPNPLDSIADLVDPSRDLIWLWGHEHWMAIYGPNKLRNGSRIFARCIGNSGMPVELNTSDGGSKRPDTNQTRNLVMFDQRKREVLDGKIPLGHNGFAVLRLQADQLSISYYDDNIRTLPHDIANRPYDELLLEEHWKIDNVSGELTPVSITDHTIVMGKMDLENQLTLRLEKDLVNAIGLARDGSRLG